MLIGHNRDSHCLSGAVKKERGQGRGRYRWGRRGSRVREGQKGGYTHRLSQIHGFDICVLLDSLLRARLSCPPLHQHLPAFAISPLVSCEKGRESLGGGRGKKTESFSLDDLQCQACRDTFKDEARVNVVGRMTEPL